MSDRFRQIDRKVIVHNLHQANQQALVRSVFRPFSWSRWPSGRLCGTDDSRVNHQTKLFFGNVGRHSEQVLIVLPSSATRCPCLSHHVVLLRYMLNTSPFNQSHLFLGTLSAKTFYSPCPPFLPSQTRHVHLYHFFSQYTNTVNNTEKLKELNPVIRAATTCTFVG